MQHFTPGNLVKTFTSQKGNEVTIRYLKPEDVHEMLRYINKLSAEDTYITFSGEVMTLEDEQKWLDNIMKQSEERDMVALGTFIGNTLISTATVTRNTHSRKRSVHVGLLAIALEKEYRGEGIGTEILTALIDEAKKNIPGLKIIELEVFGSNELAINLYKKVGFKEYGRIPGGILHKGQYVDDVAMYLTL